MASSHWSQLPCYVTELSCLTRWVLVAINVYKISLTPVTNLLIKLILKIIEFCPVSASTKRFQWKSVLSVSVQEQERCCVPECLTICFCNYQHFAVACACVPSSFEDHKYGRCSRQTRRLFGPLVNNASEVVTFSSAALFLFLCHPSFCSFHPQKAHGPSDRQKISLEKNHSETWHGSHLWRKSFISC